LQPKRSDVLRISTLNRIPGLSVFTA